MYYADPDGNGLEFQVDLLDVEQANAFMESDAFHSNAIGEPFYPDEIVAALANNLAIAPLVMRSDQTASDSTIPV